MALVKVKVSELTSETSLKGLHTLGVNSRNESVKVSLEFVQTAADTTEEAAEAVTERLRELEGLVGRLGELERTLTEKDRQRSAARLSSGETEIRVCLRGHGGQDRIGETEARFCEE